MGDGHWRDPVYPGTGFAQAMQVMRESLCLLVAVLPPAALYVGACVLLGRARFSAARSGFIAGGLAGACFVGLGQLAYSVSMTCVSLGLVFHVHAGLFALFLAAVGLFAQNDDAIGRAIAESTGPGLLIAEFLFWTVAYGGVGIVLRLLWGRWPRWWPTFLELREGVRCGRAGHR